MNLQSWFNDVAGAGIPAAARMNFFERFFRQISPDGVLSAHIMKLLSDRAQSVAVCLVWAVVLGVTSTVSGQPTNYFSANGTEYPIVGSLIGDQVFPDAAISPTNGIVVWQDNATDGSGWGISARRLDATLSGTLGTFRVNATGANDQSNPRVALLKNGGAAIVWQGGKLGFQNVFARFLTASNTFYTTNDLAVNTFTNYLQINPALAVLTNGNVIVVWSSFNQVSTNSMMDVYGQILATNGTKIGTNFLINQFTKFNQRTPAVSPLKNGGFVVAWVSEQERAAAPNWGSNTTVFSSSSLPFPSVDIYARLFNANGTPATSEFIVNLGANACANPDVAVASDGGFMVAWDEKDISNRTNGWDIHARPFNSGGIGGSAILVNTHVFGDQYVPRIKCIGIDYLVTWTSLGQDGSREGVFAQFVHNNGSLVGGEFQVNTTIMGSQMQPTLASDGVSQFLGVWTSFTGSPYGYDLFAQRYISVSAILQPMSAPCVWVPFVLSNNVYLPELVVSWAPVLGLSVTNYEVYVDGLGSPTGLVTSNSWIMTGANGLKASTTHLFQVDYVTADGRRSPLSPSASGTTWSGANYYGIPFEWMENYYGLSFSSWPANVNAPLISGGLSLYQVFVSGGNPLDPTTWLQQQLVKTPQGMFLTWNTQPGATYQVQVTTNFTTWNNLGSPRYAAGATDSINVGGGTASYYHVKLLR